MNRAIVAGLEGTFAESVETLFPASSRPFTSAVPTAGDLTVPWPTAAIHG